MIILYAAAILIIVFLCADLAALAKHQNWLDYTLYAAFCGAFAVALLGYLLLAMAPT